ncbi:unnamed protein product [Amoebophrya sp. A120]|nr:unnamed protein product [Amoebophrya sp. A120]|eukprot:GSA120T00003741001.1
MASHQRQRPQSDMIREPLDENDRSPVSDDPDEEAFFSSSTMKKKQQQTSSKDDGINPFSSDHAAFRDQDHEKGPDRKLRMDNDDASDDNEEEDNRRRGRGSRYTAEHGAEDTEKNDNAEGDPRGEKIGASKTTATGAGNRGDGAPGTTTTTRAPRVRTKTVFLGGLAPHTVAEVVEKWFTDRDIGVDHIHIPWNYAKRAPFQYAFIDLENPEDFDKCVKIFNDQEVDGRNLRCEERKVGTAKQATQLVEQQEKGKVHIGPTSWDRNRGQTTHREIAPSPRGGGRGDHRDHRGRGGRSRGRRGGGRSSSRDRGRSHRRYNRSPISPHSKFHFGNKGGSRGGHGTSRYDSPRGGGGGKGPSSPPRGKGRSRFDDMMPASKGGDRDGHFYRGDKGYGKGGPSYLSSRYEDLDKGKGKGSSRYEGGGGGGGYRRHGSRSRSRGRGRGGGGYRGDSRGGGRGRYHSRGRYY